MSDIIGGIALGCCVLVVAYGIYTLGWIAALAHCHSRVIVPWGRSIKAGDPQFWLRMADCEAASENFYAIPSFGQRPLYMRDSTVEHHRDPKYLLLQQRQDEINEWRAKS